MEHPDKRNLFHNGAIPALFVADAMQSFAMRGEAGGHSVFLGQVRSDEKNGKKVCAIEYTAYEEMALKNMQQIGEEIFTKYPLIGLRVHHSLGIIMKGEICFFVFASAAHRKAAIDACTEIVERVKTDLPIWGREIFEDESYQWKENQR